MVQDSAVARPYGAAGLRLRLGIRGGKALLLQGFKPSFPLAAFCARLLHFPRAPSDIAGGVPEDRALPFSIKEAP